MTSTPGKPEATGPIIPLSWNRYLKGLEEALIKEIESENPDEKRIAHLRSLLCGNDVLNILDLPLEGIAEQRKHIAKLLAEGTIDEDRAAELTTSLDDLEAVSKSGNTPSSKVTGFQQDLLAYREDLRRGGVQMGLDGRPIPEFREVLAVVRSFPPITVRPLGYQEPIAYGPMGPERGGMPIAWENQGIEGAIANARELLERLSSGGQINTTAEEQLEALIRELEED